MKWKELLTPVASMDAEEARRFMNEHKEGSYTLLDVRQPTEYEAARIPGVHAYSHRGTAGQDRGTGS